MELAPTYGRRGPGDVPPVEHDLRAVRAAAEGGRTIVLVEGLSDKAAIDALAKRHGRNLHDEGITIVAIGGATRIWRFLDLLGPLGLDVKLSGLCDRQPEWQEQSSQAQLRRWLGTTAHRKISYAPLLVDALDMDRVLVPLDRLLARLASLKSQ